MPEIIAGGGRDHSAADWSIGGSVELLRKLHASISQKAFVKLYLAIKEEPHLQWLIDRIDNFDHQSLIDLVQELCVSDQTGECVCVKERKCAL